MTLVEDPTKHIGLVKKFVLREGPFPCWDEAEGVANLALVRACTDFRPELGFRFSTFGAKYIITALRTHKRREYQKCRDKGRTRPLTDVTAARVGYRPEPSAFEQEDAELDRNLEVDHILSRVSERSEIVLLARASGMTQKEIAEKYGVTPQAVQSWERIAMRELHEAAGTEQVFQNWTQVQKANWNRRNRMGLFAPKGDRLPPREMVRH